MDTSQARRTGSLKAKKFDLSNGSIPNGICNEGRITGSQHDMEYREVFYAGLKSKNNGHCKKNGQSGFCQRDAIDFSGKIRCSGNCVIKFLATVLSAVSETDFSENIGF